MTVPLLNPEGRTTTLPSRESLGTWVPTKDEVEVMELDGEFDRGRVRSWLEQKRT